MKAAFAHWNRRIAPVFDVAQQVLVVEAREGAVVEETPEPLPDEDPARKSLRLAELGVEILVCGAISRPLHAMVSAYGIRVMPFMAGDLDGIVRAWARGDLSEDRFAMPGCRGGGRRHRWCAGEESGMNTPGGRRGGGGQGGGRGGGAGRGGRQGLGRGGGGGQGGGRGGGAGRGRGGDFGGRGRWWAQDGDLPTSAGGGASGAAGTATLETTGASEALASRTAALQMKLDALERRLADLEGRNREGGER